jgi:hypothetical protein
MAGTVPPVVAQPRRRGRRRHVDLARADLVELGRDIDDEKLNEIIGASKPELLRYVTTVNASR